MQLGILSILLGTITFKKYQLIQQFKVQLYLLRMKKLRQIKNVRLKNKIKKMMLLLRDYMNKMHLRENGFT